MRWVLFCAELLPKSRVQRWIIFACCPFPAAEMEGRRGTRPVHSSLSFRCSTRGRSSKYESDLITLHTQRKTPCDLDLRTIRFQERLAVASSYEAVG